MNNNQTRTKRIWLFMLFVLPIFYLSLLAVFISFQEGFRSLNMPASIENERSLLQNYACKIVINSLISLPFMYFFAYKKQGRVLLTLCIWFGILHLVFSIFDFPKLYMEFVHIQLLKNSVDMKSIWTVYFLKYVLFFRIFDLITTVVWIIFCCKLKKINLEERFNRLIADEKYKNIFDSFEKITDRQALEDFYGQVTHEHPVVEKFLIPKYKKKKQELYSL